MVTINGKEYPGNNVCIINGQVMIDGKPIDGEEGQIDTDKTEIVVTGDLASLQVDHGVVTVNGNIGGDVQGQVVNVAGDVKGNVEANVVNSGKAAKGMWQQSGQTTVIPNLTINA